MTVTCESGTERLSRADRPVIAISMAPSSSEKPEKPDGLIGTHPATNSQLFLVISGEGWVAGPDGRHIDIRTGWAVRWNTGEEHTTGTQTGLIALAVEGAPLDLFEPEIPAG